MRGAGVVARPAPDPRRGSPTPRAHQRPRRAPPPGRVDARAQLRPRRLARASRATGTGDEVGVAEVGGAVGERELHRLGDAVDRAPTSRRRARAGSMPSRMLQRLDQRDAAGGRRRKRQDLVAAVAGRAAARAASACSPRGPPGEDAAARLHLVGDRAGERRRGAIALGPLARDPPQRRGEIRLHEPPARPRRAVPRAGTGCARSRGSARPGPSPRARPRACARDRARSRSRARPARSRARARRRASSVP